MNEEEETYALTEEGMETVMRIDELFRTTDYDLERIAFEVGLDDPLDVQVLYAMGNLSGLIDVLHEGDDEYGA